jgi:Zn-dependent M16 (insulinase) family peptidase
VLIVTQLQLSDIPQTITKVPTATSSLAGGATLLTHELFTNDVLYAEAALDLKGLPANLLPLLPLFCRSLTQVNVRWYRAVAAAGWMACQGGLAEMIQQ